MQGLRWSCENDFAALESRGLLHHSGESPGHVLLQGWKVKINDKIKR